MGRIKYHVSTFSFRKAGIRYLLAIAIALLLFYQALGTRYQTPAFAQSPLEQAQNDYTFQFTKYRDALDKYLVAKASYETFKTAVAKNEAYIKTKDYLYQVDNVYNAYILLVKIYLSEVDWKTQGAQKDNLAASLDTQIESFKSHQQKVTNAATLEELPPLALGLKDHVNTNFNPVVNRAIATMETVEIESAFADFSSLSQILDTAINEKRQETNVSLLANWSTQVEDIRTKAQAQVTQTRSTLDRIPSLADGHVVTISTFAQNAKNQLKRAKPLFEEVVRIL